MYYNIQDSSLLAQRVDVTTTAEASLINIILISLSLAFNFLSSWY